MLKRFAFHGKILYICIAKRRRHANTGLSPHFLPKMTVVFPQRDENLSLRAKFFSLRADFFSVQLVRAAALPEVFFGPQIIKNIKVFSAKKLDFR